MEGSCFLLQQQETNQLRFRMIIFEIFVANLRNESYDSRMNQTMKELINELALICEHVEVVDWQVVQNMARWVVAWALATRQSPIRCLTNSMLTCLIDISCCIRSVSSLLLP